MPARSYQMMTDKCCACPDICLWRNGLKQAWEFASVLHLEAKFMSLDVMCYTIFQWVDRWILLIQSAESLHTINISADSIMCSKQATRKHIQPSGHFKHIHRHLFPSLLPWQSSQHMYTKKATISVSADFTISLQKPSDRLPSITKLVKPQRCCTC